MLKISLLGPFAVSQDNAPVLGFKTDFSRAILALTAYHRGIPQRRDAIAGMLWPDAPNDKALKYFRVELNRLRPVIGDAEANPAHFFINRKEIEFNPDSQAVVDVVQFESLLDEVAQHGHRTLAGCPSCISKLEQAADLYAGEFMDGFHLNSDVWQAWVTKQREGFKIQAADLFGQLTEVQVERGEWDAALELAQRLIAIDPWKEEAYQALMRGNYFLGDRAAAMGWYEACEKVLYEELGVDPSAETLDLQQQILDDELDLISTGSVTVPDNLPVQTSPFFGREAEKEKLQTLLVDPNYRLVTLVGAGGIGKTRLSIEVGQRVKESFPDGVWFVQLADLSNGMENVKIAVGEAAGLATDDKQLSGDQVIAILREKKMLLIFDNSETMLNDIAFIPEWLKRAPGIAILASSREPLNFQTETVVYLSGLELNAGADTLEEAGAAVGLFGERGKMARSDFEMTAEQLPLVQDICQMVGGSPLGIALAAGWLRRRSLTQIIDSIGQSLDFLTSKMRDIDPRHRSMRAVFETSWELLEPEEQEVFAALSVFPSNFSEAAASKICGASLFDLDELCEKSMLQQMQEAERYQMHGLLRQYGAGKLAEVQQTAKSSLARAEAGSTQTEVEAAFVTYFSTFATLNKADYDKLRPEWANFSAAIEIAQGQQAWQQVLDLTNTLDEPWFRQARFFDMRHGLALAVEAAKFLQDEEAFAQKLLRLGELEIEQNDYAAAEPRVANAMQQFMRLEDSLGVAKSKYFLGRILREKSDFDKAAELHEQSSLLFEEEKNFLGLAQNLNYLALCIVQKNQDFQKAETMLLQSKQLQESNLLTSTYIETLRSLGRIKVKLKEHDHALQVIDLAIKTSLDLSDRGEYGASLFEKIIFYKRTAQFDKGIALSSNCLDIFKEIGSLRWQGLVRTQIGILHQCKRQFRLASEEFLASTAIFNEIGDLHELAYSYFYLFRLNIDKNDLPTANHYLDLAKTLNTELKSEELGRLLQA